MALNLYRRHGSHCLGGRVLHHRTFEPDELRRGWRKCACPIYASGTLSGQFRRKNTESVGWVEAKATVAEWQRAGLWDHPVDHPASTPPAGDCPQRITVAEALNAYLAIRSGSGMAVSTLRKHRTFVKQLGQFAGSRGYIMLDQFPSSDIDLFYGSLKLGARSKGNALGTLRGFFRFCVNREWLAKSPVTADLKPPLGAKRVANKHPFTDDELDRIMNACDKLDPIAWSNDKTQGVWTGQDVKDFIWVMVYTGSRISDVGLLNINRLRGNELFLRAKKNGGDVYTWVPDWLRDRLQQLAKERGLRPFVAGRSERLETVTDLWRRKINRVFDLVGHFEERATPHRFRHTFARILLQKGVPVADVADLLGDDENTVRQHYARWVPERQARLTSILRDAFDGKPSGNVVSMPRRAV